MKIEPSLKLSHIREGIHTRCKGDELSVIRMCHLALYHCVDVSRGSRFENVRSMRTAGITVINRQSMRLIAGNWVTVPEVGDLLLSYIPESNVPMGLAL